MHTPCPNCLWEHNTKVCLFANLLWMPVFTKRPWGSWYVRALEPGRDWAKGLHSILLWVRLQIWPPEAQVESPWIHHALATVLGGERLELEPDVWEAISQTSQYLPSWPWVWQKLSDWWVPSGLERAGARPGIWAQASGRICVPSLTAYSSHQSSDLTSVPISPCQEGGLPTTEGLHICCLTRRA